MIYLELLISFMQIGLFSVGGGYAALSLIQDQAVNVHGWLTLQSFADVMTISQMAPGSIAINCAVFVGMQVAGLPGAVAAAIGCALPSSIIIMILSFAYYRYRGIDPVQSVLNGLRPAVVAMIATAALSLISVAFLDNCAPGDINLLNVIIFLLSLAVLRRFKASPIIIIIGAGAIGLAVNCLI